MTYLVKSYEREVREGRIDTNLTSLTPYIQTLIHKNVKENYLDASVLIEHDNNLKFNC